MIAIFVIMFFLVYLCFFFPLETKREKKEEKSPKYNNQMKKLWQIAQTAMKERKPFRAEKALLTILKFDEKNAAAYNRLGILYAKSKKYDEAVECFEIAQSLDNNPASIHNVGLIYLETGAYEKAAMAFNQAIELEGDVPARYIALAKAEEKLGRTKKAVDALENAYELDPKVTTLREILAIYENNGDTEAATATSARIETQITRDNEAKRRRALERMRRNMTPKRSVKTEKVGTSVRTRGGVRGLVSKTPSKSAPRVIKSHVGRKRI
ncbi:MAG: tetratricopeptide repeat protein [Candidatus Saccharibacteria bacterium]|nr:tetratricopeptide repeat protein [Candidatus Saccharibacteria bacterium]